MNNIIQTYCRSYSRSLGRDMEYKIYGTEGRPVLVFPSQDGRFYDYEDFGMVDAAGSWIESKKIRLICVDSIDRETWSDTNGDVNRRIELHERWFHYITDELLPVVTKSDERIIVTGCSMGGYHAANFFFRRPDLFDTLLSLSGLYNADYFFGRNYNNELVYANSPLDYLPNMPADHPYLDLYRKRKLVFCVGQGPWEEDLLESTRRMEKILKEKNIPAWVDYWGHDVSHDWMWWRKQLVYFLPKIL